MCPSQASTKADSGVNGFHSPAALHVGDIASRAADGGGGGGGMAVHSGSSYPDGSEWRNHSHGNHTDTWRTRARAEDRKCKPGSK
ncbi:hypothetical protein EYF80_001373 [Liparis tanakae]|uniref:Uncharacterized protein n=1 Tax=Liparis tanakae TaxID=230148 RepID=A0A4Z2JEI1_9TELE|nr:hypothetical protein EYF80_001373 [Liparis tanakae]